jgi:L-arabinose isomerase
MGSPELSVSGAQLGPRRTRDLRPVVGLVAGGLGAYWPQFPDLLPQLERSARLVAQRLRRLDANVVDAGFISDAREADAAAQSLYEAGCDLIVCFRTTYMTAGAAELAALAELLGLETVTVTVKGTR